MRPGTIHAHIDPITKQAGTLTGSLTTAEHLVYVIAHETYHQHYANMPENNWENHANGWGAHAVKRYREGAGAACPAK
jgi:hypothetical protein